MLAAELTSRGHRVSHVVVDRLLKAEGYSLQANAKVIEGRQSPDRDAQFAHLNATVSAALAAVLPVISVSLWDLPLMTIPIVAWLTGLRSPLNVARISAWRKHRQC